VVIPSRSSIRTALKIKKMAEDVKIPKISFIGNLVRNEEDKQFLIDALGATPIVFFPDSEGIRKAEREETAIIKVEKDRENAPQQLLKEIFQE
jgi:CO dehydrogenase maturation factor